jgi:hypothetical protein
VAHHGGHGYPRTRQLMELRRKEAEERQLLYDQLTTQEKLDQLPPEPHCAKQRKKLLARLAEEQGKSSGS